MTGSRRTVIVPAWWPTVALVVVCALFWQIGSGQHWWSPQILPAPSEIWNAGRIEYADGPLMEDLATSVRNFILCWLIGTGAGALSGYVFWLSPFVGRAFEPYLVAFYAVPIVVFYPAMLVIIGLGSWPIIIIGSIMAAIPMALNTWVGLSGVKRVYLNLGKVLCLPRWKLLKEIAIPAASPMMIAGATMAAVYSLIGVVAMEFMVAQEGLGYRIRYRYESFNNDGMYFYIIITLVIAVIMISLLALLPKVLGVGRKAR